MQLIIDGIIETVEALGMPMLGWDEFYIIRNNKRVSSIQLPVSMEPGQRLNTQGKIVEVPA